MLNINVLRTKLQDISYRVISENINTDRPFEGLEEAIEKGLDLKVKFSSTGYHTVHNLTLTRLKNCQNTLVVVSRVEATISYHIGDMSQVIVDVTLSI